MPHQAVAKAAGLSNCRRSQVPALGAAASACERAEQWPRALNVLRTVALEVRTPRSEPRVESPGLPNQRGAAGHSVELLQSRLPVATEPRAARLDAPTQRHHLHGSQLGAREGAALAVGAGAQLLRRTKTFKSLKR